MTDTTRISFEISPPLKGAGMQGLRKVMDRLAAFAPQYINITTHRSEPIYREVGMGLLERSMLKRRPGTVAVAAALQQEYHIPIVPHILCGGFTMRETEYLLIDLQYLGITNLLLLRGDKGREDHSFHAMEGGHAHTTDLIAQINRFNDGYFLDGTQMRELGEKFSYGVACYPEKHEESPNLETDLGWFAEKVKMGAQYGVTQMFFDNSKYFGFVDRARAMGVKIPVVPGIKPLVKRSQLTMLPRLFHCDLPEELSREALKCKDDDAMRALGTEWCVEQCRDLMRRGVPSIHFYCTGNADVVETVAKQVF